MSIVDSLPERGERFTTNIFRRALVSGFIASQLVACSADAPERSSDPTVMDQENEAESPEAPRPEQMWAEALYDLRAKIDSSETVELTVAWGTCIYWPAAIGGTFTAIRNPAIFNYQAEEERLYFIPFVPSSPDVPVVMNGPFQYHRDLEDSTGVGNLGGIETREDALVFEPVRTKLRIVQELEPTVFTAGWMEDEVGNRISETMLVLAEDLDTTFSDTCSLGTSEPLTS